MVDFEVCLGSLSRWNTQPRFNFNVWTDLQTLASRILLESIVPSTSKIFAVPPAATQAQSIMDPHPCLTVGKVLFSIKASPFFSPKDTFFSGTQKVQFCFFQSKAHKGFMLLSVFFCILLMLNFVLRSSERLLFGNSV